MKHLADLTDPRIAKLYQDVPANEMEKFQAFCQVLPYRQVNYGGVDWDYLVNSKGGEALLLLSGALAIPDISWNTIAHFAEEYRVIVPAYPAVKTMGELMEGIAEILRREGIQRAHVLGGSYGGFVAQVFVRRYPEMVRSLVLSHTLPPYRETGEKIRKTMGLLRVLPEGLLRWLLGKRMGALLPEKTDQVALMYALYRELLDLRLKKADFLGIFWRTVDYCALQFTPQDLAEWEGRVLLVLADDDPGTPEAVRLELSRLYPPARMHLFHGTGHASSVLNQEEYQAVIGAFLRGEA
jgi:pimeloyl-ACP methyl ester carboxylesterase